MTWAFPPAASADATGLVAVTEGIDADLLEAAYRQGIFPWSDTPVRWYSPEPRAIFVPQRLHLPKNLGKLWRRGGFEVRLDTAFTAVVEACAAGHADDGVWITPRFVDAYTALHRRGLAHSVETWQDGRLVGGLYGVHLAAAFCGESMFHHVADASKVAFAALTAHLADIGVVLLDAQVINRHTARLGAVQVPRAAFLVMLQRALALPCAAAGRPWVARPEGLSADTYSERRR